MCSFEWIGLHFKAVFRRLSGAKSRETNAEMQFKAPKMHLGEFRNTLYSHSTMQQGLGWFFRSGNAERREAMQKHR
ncbi:MAG: hypothetical protein IJH09_12495, partial [Clostridia bacterium]|nr:hypothetical protein [Clostridia bacterium]